MRSRKRFILATLVIALAAALILFLPFPQRLRMSLHAYPVESDGMDKEMMLTVRGWKFNYLIWQDWVKGDILVFEAGSHNPAGNYLIDAPLIDVPGASGFLTFSGWYMDSSEESMHARAFYTDGQWEHILITSITEGEEPIVAARNGLSDPASIAELFSSQVPELQPPA